MPICFILPKGLNLSTNGGHFKIGQLGSIRCGLSNYSKISELTEKQVALVNSYNQAWGLLKADTQFTADELSYMTKVYSGILEASVNDLDQILLVINANKTQMPDAKRMEIVNKAADHMDSNYNDLQQFNSPNQILSLQRAKDQNAVITLKKYHGLE